MRHRLMSPLQHFNLPSYAIHASTLLLALLTIGTPIHAQRVLVEDYRIGAFEQARRIAVDAFGNVLVTDAGSATVRKLSIDGTTLADVGGPGWDAGRFDQPMGLDASLAVAMYVADRNNRRIVRLDRDLNVVATLDSETPGGERRFGYPVDVVASSFEQLFVLDAENSLVVTLSGFDRVDRRFGGVDAGEGRLHDPVAMARGGNDRLYVLERGRVVVFDVFGNFIGQFGRDILDDARGIAVCPPDGAAANTRIHVVTAKELHVFAADGSHLESIGRDRMVIADEPLEFVDVACTSLFLLLLTPRYCILIPAN